MAQRQCPNCGMQQTEWLASAREGFPHDGQLYCCEGCASGGGCTCRMANLGHRSPEGGAALLVTPRDANGRPLEAGERPDETTQLVESAGVSPARTPERGPDPSA